MRISLFESLQGQAVLFCFALAVIFVVAPSSMRASRRDGSTFGISAALLWPLSMSAALIAARLFLESSIRLPADSFEEQGLGLQAFFTLGDGLLSMEFRYATLLGFFGLTLGSLDYDSLRAPFSLLGCASLVAFVFGLRGAGVSGLGVFAAGSVVACSSFFTICSSRADELCYGAGLSIIYIALLLRIERCKGTGLGSFGLLGIFTGMLMFEHSAYKLLALVGVAFAAVSIFRYRSSGWARRAAVLGLTFLVMISPILNDMTKSGFGSSIFDGLYRHVYTRGTFLDERWPEFLRNGAAVLLGAGPSDHRLTLPGHTILSPWIGAIWGAAWLLAILRGKTIERFLAAHVLLTLIGGTAITRNFEPIRLAPAFASLSVLLALGFERASRSNGASPIRLSAWNALLTGWTLFVIAGSFSFHAELGRSLSFRRVFSGGDFPHCSHIARHAGDADQVLVLSPGKTFACYNLAHPRSLAYESEGSWLYGNRVPVRRLADLAFPEGVPPRSLIMIADKPGVGPENERMMEALASSLGGGEIDRSFDMDGRLSAVSYCYRCGE